MVAGAVAKLGSELFGVGVVELVEDDQCLLPGVVSRPGIAGRHVGIAEVGQATRLVIGFAEVVSQANRL